MERNERPNGHSEPWWGPSSFARLGIAGGNERSPRSVRSPRHEALSRPKSSNSAGGKNHYSKSNLEPPRIYVIIGLLPKITVLHRQAMKKQRKKGTVNRYVAGIKNVVEDEHTLGESRTYINEQYTISCDKTIWDIDQQIYISNQFFQQIANLAVHPVASSHCNVLITVYVVARPKVGAARDFGNSIKSQ